MDESFRVGRVNDFHERNDCLRDYVPVLSAAAGDDQLPRLVPSLDRMEDDVLLQHAVTPEGGLTGFKYVESAQFQIAQEVFAESTEVRAIAKASWCNADKLPASHQQALNEA